MPEPRQACPPDVLNEAAHSVQLLLCSLSNGDLGPNGLVVLPYLAADGIVLSLNGLTVQGMRLLQASYLSRVSPSSLKRGLIIPPANDSLQQTQNEKCIEMLPGTTPFNCRQHVRRPASSCEGDHIGDKRKGRCCFQKKPEVTARMILICPLLLS